MNEGGELPPLPSPEDMAGDMGGVSRTGDPFKDNPQLEEMLSDRIDMHDAYYATFSERSGKKVLKHLEGLHSFSGDSLYAFTETHADTAFKLGQRFVIESIKRFLDTAPDEMKKQIMAIEERKYEQERHSYGSSYK